MENLILDLSNPVLNIDKQPMQQDGKPLTLGRVLGNALFMATKASKDDALRFYTWAIQLAGDGKITVNKGDVQTLQTFVTGIEGMAVAVKAPILEALLSLSK